MATPSSRTNVPSKPGPHDWRAVEMELSQVEAQHRKLFEMIGTLQGKLATGATKGDVSQALQFLHDYAQFHFLNEERLMYEYRYDNRAYWDHVKEHKAFAQQFEQLSNRFRQGGDGAALMDAVKRQLVSWLEEHIKKVDRKLLDFLKASGCK